MPGGGQRPILTLTLNPALDMATGVAKLIPGDKLRCDEPLLDPGGGGLNVSRAIRALDGESLALVALGGLTGDRLARLMRAEGLAFLAIHGPGETRQSLSVRETATGLQYRFMLPGPVWQAEDRARVFPLLRATARPGGFSVVSGSQPPGVPVDFPAELAAAMPDSQIVLDTSGPALMRAVSHPIPGLQVLRMDGAEAEALAGRPLHSRAETADFAQALARQGVAQMVVVARGAEGNLCADATRRLFATAPAVPVVSTVGAGDSFVAAFVLALARGEDAGKALSRGSAAAAAAVMTDATQLCRREDAERLLAEVNLSTV